MSDLRDILARTLAAQGALVEQIQPDGLEIFAPKHLQETLELAEWSRVGFGTVLPEEAVRVSLESGWAQRLLQLQGLRGKYATYDLPFGCPSPPALELERELGRAFVLENATFRMKDVAQAMSFYFLLVFHVTSTSDDKREDVLFLCINESNGSMADHLVSPLLAKLREERRSRAADPMQVELPLSLFGQRLRELTSRRLPRVIRTRLVPFLAGMERRMSRDLERLHAYYSDLQSETAARLVDRKRKGGDSQAVEAEEKRLQAIEQEYAAKVADLDRKYAVSIEAKLTQVVRARLPVLRADLVLLRRKGVRRLQMDWSALAKGFDQLVCEACFGTPRSFRVCDDKLHCVCSACMTACLACAKEYCRACHPVRCPKCGHGRQSQMARE
jgi:hypothetical protein